MSEKVFIDLDEEIIFITEKIKKVEGEKVILVVPERASLLGSIVSLKLLFSELVKSNKSVILVTNDEVGLRLASKANFVSVKRVNQISKDSWKKAETLKQDAIDKSEKAKNELISERKEKDVQVDDIKPELPSAPEESKKSTGSETLGAKISPKKIDIGGFEMVSGGDIAEIEPLTDEIETPETKKDEEKKEERKSSRYSAYKEAKEKEGLVGKDLSTFSYTSKASQMKRKKGKVKQGSSAGDKAAEIGEKIKEFFTSGGQRQKIIIGVVVALLVFFLLSYFVLPRAEVKIIVESQDIGIEEEVIADTAVSTLDVSSLTIPARALSVKDDASESADATGKKPTGEVASGQITIYNKTESEITIPEGTIVSAIETGLKYQIVSSGTVPAKQGDSDPEPGAYGIWDEVGIRADKFGADYNINGKMEFTIQGFDAENIYGKSFSNITGGTTENKKVVSPEDYDNLKKTLQEKLEESLITMLETEAGTEREVLQDTIEYEVINENCTPVVDAEADSFTFNITVEATALSFAKDDIDRLAETLADQSGSDVEIEEFEYNSEVVKTEGNQIHIKLMITGIVTPSVDKEELKTNLKSKSQNAALEYLDNLEGIKNYELTLYPSWLPSSLKHFPSSTNRIDINIEKM